MQKEESYILPVSNLKNSMNNLPSATCEDDDHHGSWLRVERANSFLICTGYAYIPRGIETTSRLYRAVMFALPLILTLAIQERRKFLAR